MAESMTLTGVLDHMDEKVDGGKLTLGEIVDALGPRGYGPLLVSLALVEILPTGAIPGVPTLIAIFVILLAGQLLLGRSAPWIPNKLSSKGFSEEKFKSARRKARPYTEKVDKVIKPRLSQLASPLAARIIAGICVLLALTMPPLEFIPFASSIPASAIGLLGLGLSAQDGLLILFGLIIALGAFGGAFYWLAF